jgi:hypothetical protein
MTDWVTIVLALAVLVVPLACAYVVVQRLGRHRCGKKKTGGNGMPAGA